MRSRPQRYPARIVAALSLTPLPAHRHFARYASGVLAFNLGVILWGAVVRATGSGAGCGSHWPSCDGDIVPALEDGRTAIEFVHRATSGLALLAVVALAVWARKLYQEGDPVRRASVLAVGVIFVEAAIGAVLVLAGWTEDDSSIGRIVSIALHQANTLLLIGVLASVAWWASGGSLPSRSFPSRDRRLLGAGFAALVVVGAAGAVTALGDTLFPAESLVEGLRADTSVTSQFLVRLRVIHPVLAIVSGLYIVVVARRLGATARDRFTEPIGRAVVVVVGLQVLAGFINVAFLAPLGMQLLHLFLADLLTIAVTLLALSALSQANVEPAVAPLQEPVT